MPPRPTANGHGRSREPSPLGTFLRELRTQSEMTVREVAEQSGVSNPYVSQIENGVCRDPSPNILRKLVAVYSPHLRYQPRTNLYIYLMELAGYIKEDDLTRGLIDATRAKLEQERAEIEQTLSIVKEKLATFDSLFNIGDKNS